MNAFNVRVSRENPFWVAVVDSVSGGATESRTLSALESEVRDLLSGLLDVEEDEIALEWDYSEALGDSAELLTRYQAARRELEQAKRDYKAAQNSVVRALRDRGISVRDSANLVHVSHQRISQLANS